MSFAPNRESETSLEGTCSFLREGAEPNEGRYMSRAIGVQDVERRAGTDHGDFSLSIDP